MQRQQLLFPRASFADFHNPRQQFSTAAAQAAHNGMRQVTQYHHQVFRPQTNAVRQLQLTPLAAKGPMPQSVRLPLPPTAVRQFNPPPLAAKGLTAQAIGVKQFNTGRMAARPDRAFMTAGAVKNAMNMQLKGNGHLKWNLNHTSVWGANRGTFAPVGVSVTKTPQSSPVHTLDKGTQQPVFPGGNKGTVTKDGGMHIKAPVNGLLKFKNMLGLREEVHSHQEVSSSGRLVAIDFDKTIAEVFLWAELGGLEGPDAQLQNLYSWCLNGKLLAAFGGQQRVDELRAVLQKCKDRGDLLCVLSSGYAKVIRPALRFLKLDGLIPDNLVYGSDTSPFGISKSTRVNHLKRQHNRARATLVDDDVGYCRTALQDGHDVIWVKNGAGVQKREFDPLLNQEWDRVEYLTHFN
eukprot:GEMP01065033.1.p1 GENE.GEMP01065033.1~~GEMP01065033.1.p1  ORF type:complete len:406 (+),score=78.43 GEMP01065033.1:70-1287(+)